MPAFSLLLFLHITHGARMQHPPTHSRAFAPHTFFFSQFALPSCSRLHILIIGPVCSQLAQNVRTCFGAPCAAWQRRRAAARWGPCTVGALWRGGPARVQLGRTALAVVVDVAVCREPSGRFQLHHQVKAGSTVDSWRQRLYRHRVGRFHRVAGSHHLCSKLSLSSKLFDLRFVVISWSLPLSRLLASLLLLCVASAQAHPHSAPTVVALHGWGVVAMAAAKTFNCFLVVSRAVGLRLPELLRQAVAAASGIRRIWSSSLGVQHQSRSMHQEQCQELGSAQNDLMVCVFLRKFCVGVWGTRTYD